MTATAIPSPFPARDYNFQAYGPCRNYIAGEFVDAASGQTLAIENPRHGKSMGEVVMSDASDVARAVAAATVAYPAWKATPLKERVQVLYRMKQLMEANVEELTWLLSHENGKTYPEAKGSVLKAVECLEMGCSLPNMVGGPQLDVSRGINCSVSYEPLGVCAGVVPFNFPTMVPMWMLPQALIAGNTFILKPSEQVPYGAMRLAQLFAEAGLPPGVLNIVNGAKPAVEGLVEHPDIKALGFVGSTRVAKLVYARGAATGKRTLCLGGAKNHLLVVPDAELELTASTLLASFTACAGQRCMAASVLLAIGDVEPIIDALVAKTRAMQLGSDMGSIINASSVERITRYVDEAERLGAKVLVDGRGAKVDSCPEGHWFGPTLLDNVTPEMPAGCEEIFGPVLSIIRCKTLDEAIAIENASGYGNAAAIFTTNGGVARYCSERFEAGMCGVNIGVPVPREPFAFGGWNDSKFGHGDITGLDGYRFWTRPRKLTSRWEKSSDATWMS